MNFDEIRKQSELLIKMRKEYITKFNTTHTIFETLVEEIKIKNLLLPKWELEYLSNRR